MRFILLAKNAIGMEDDNRNGGEMVKTTGAEWNKFYSDQDIWGNGQWHDDVVIRVDGANVEDYETLPDTAKVEIDGGYVFLSDGMDKEGPSMETYFRQWKKNQTTIFLAVECPREKYEDVILAIKSAGGIVK
jgi:hypothetical protein